MTGSRALVDNLERTRRRADDLETENAALRKEVEELSYQLAVKTGTVLALRERLERTYQYIAEISEKQSIKRHEYEKR